MHRVDRLIFLSYYKKVIVKETLISELNPHLTEITVNDPNEFSIVSRRRVNWRGGSGKPYTTSIENETITIRDLKDTSSNNGTIIKDETQVPTKDNNILNIPLPAYLILNPGTSSVETPPTGFFQPGNLMAPKKGTMDLQQGKDYTFGRITIRRPINRTP